MRPSLPASVGKCPLVASLPCQSSQKLGLHCVLRPDDARVLLQFRIDKNPKETLPEHGLNWMAYITQGTVDTDICEGIYTGTTACQSYGNPWTTVTLVTLMIWVTLTLWKTMTYHKWLIRIYFNFTIGTLSVPLPGGLFSPGMLWMVMARMRRRMRRQLLPFFPTSSCCLLPVSCSSELPEWGPLLLWWTSPFSILSVW